jgi:hypothetical protein
MIEHLEIFHLDEAGAAGVVLAAGAVRILWTAMRGHAGAWFIRLHRRVRTIDNDGCARLIDEIARRVALLPKSI